VDAEVDAQKTDADAELGGGEDEAQENDGEA
jgi:hypothetical protein